MTAYLFDQYLGRGRSSGGDETRYVCPFCKDPDRTFSLSHTRKRFICFKGSCGVSGTLAYLASKLGFEYHETPLLSSIDQMRHRLWDVDSGVKPAPKIDEPVEVPPLKQIEPGCYAWDYLISRGLTSGDIYYNELSLSLKDGGRRIYFPQRDEVTGRINFWVARKYLPGHHKGRKYVNPGGSIKKRLLYRSHLINRNYPVAVCEGPISAILAGNAVATLGVLFSKEQVEEIAKLGTPILAAMDGEAFSKSLELARKLEPFGTPTTVVPMPAGTDPADLGRHNFLNLYVPKAFSLEPGTVADVKERLTRLW